jgi:predicted ABC-type ATPase
VPTVEDSIARVALRVAKGGHNVPEADIRRRSPRTHENLAWFAQHADAVDVLANTWDAQPKLVAQARAGRVALLHADTLPAVTQALRPLT